MTNLSFYAGKRVLVTGHTGFKGSWLCETLLRLGADVTGLALDPPTNPSLFTDLGLTSRMRDRRGDIRSFEEVRAVVKECRPEIVFHMAAQSLVRPSYEIPVETFDTNVQGTVHVLEALRTGGHRSAVVVVTSDKCYENREWVHAYREEDPMGGHDPYSASKGCAELVAAAYRRSYFGPNSPIALSTVRAGNVIGGGDWAVDRIVPDCARHLENGSPIPVRNPAAIRPWQHVLDPLTGYMLLGVKLRQNLEGDSMERAKPENAVFETAFNFGPDPDSSRTVGELVNEFVTHWPGQTAFGGPAHAVHEAMNLELSSHKARRILGWKPVWDFGKSVEKSAAWYRNRALGGKKPDVVGFTRAQIEEYCKDASKKGSGWS